jgi:hypothetical protein
MADEHFPSPEAGGRVGNLSAECPAAAQEQALDQAL